MKKFVVVVSMVALMAASAAAQGMMGGYGYGGYGRGMMGGYGYGGYGRGMMGGYGYGGYGRGMMGGYDGCGQGMMGAYDYIPPGNQAPLTIDQAVDQAGRYLASWGDERLRIAEVMEFSNHFYIEVGEKDGDRKALELIMNRYTGAVYPEPGPNMMWNRKYGMMGGLLSQPQTAEAMPITEAKARELAQKVLDARQPGLKVEDGADRFYGYYTLHVLKDGAVYGMLGVNGYTGQVWYHTWHGTFVAAKELADRD